MYAAGILYPSLPFAPRSAMRRMSRRLGAHAIVVIVDQEGCLAGRSDPKGGQFRLLAASARVTCSCLAPAVACSLHKVWQFCRQKLLRRNKGSGDMAASQVVISAPSQPKSVSACEEKAVSDTSRSTDAVTELHLSFLPFCSWRHLTKRDTSQPSHACHRS